MKRNSHILLAIISLGIFRAPTSALAQNVTADSLAQHESWKLFQEDCGDSNADRIIGGVDANLGQYPWIARLGYKLNGVIVYACGGVLISKRYVLTAAHCSEGIVTVRLGEYDVTTDPDCKNDVCAKPVQDFTPEAIVIHTEYNQPLYTHDITLVRLDREVDLNGWVAPICLYRDPTVDAAAGQVTEAAGWGYVSMKTMAVANVLQTVKLPVIDREWCKQRFINTAPIVESELCAGGVANEDACGGDSGGPLMKVDDVSGEPKMYLLGVVSFGPTNCGNTIPGIYTRVPSFTKWILDNVQP